MAIRHSRLLRRFEDPGRKVKANTRTTISFEVRWQGPALYTYLGILSAWRNLSGEIRVPEGRRTRSPG